MGNKGRHNTKKPKGFKVGKKEKAKDD